MLNKSKDIFKLTLPVFSGYIVLGMGFGILMRSSGFNLFHVMLMSVFVYAGSLQYAGCVMMAAQESYLTIALSSLFINARHLFYGISMIDEYKKPSKYKSYLIFALTDETYSLVCNKDKDQYTNFLISIFDQSYWVIGSLIGGLLGSIITFDTTGIDFSLTALFLVVCSDQWLNSKNHLPAIFGIVLSALCVFIFGPSNFLIPAMCLITAALLISRRYL